MDSSSIVSEVNERGILPPAAMGRKAAKRSAGALRVVAAEGGPRRGRLVSEDSPTLNETNDDHDDRDDQQQVNQSADRTHGAEGPQHKQNNDDSPEQPVALTRHGASSERRRR